MAQQASDITPEANTYALGHSAAVLSSHTSRTASNCAFYLVPHLTTTSTIRDVGCGPGTITCDLAAIATSGKVIGLDTSSSVTDTARETASSRQLTNVSFQVGNVHSLPFEDDSFDVVHAHMTFVHLPNPEHAFAEVRRVCKPGGVVAIRECDWDSLTIYPETAPLRKWRDATADVLAADGAEANAGRMLRTWATAVGFDRKKVEVGATAITYATEELAKWWGEMHAQRLKDEGGISLKMVQKGVATEEEIEEMAGAWLNWSKDELALWALMTVHVLCWK